MRILMETTLGLYRAWWPSLTENRISLRVRLSVHYAYPQNVAWMFRPAVATAERMSILVSRMRVRATPIPQGDDDLA